VRPDRLEAGVDGGSVCRTPLVAEALGQAVEGLAVFRQAREILTVYGLRLAVPPFDHQGGAERVPHGQQPGRGFVVAESVLGLHRVGLPG